LLYYCNMVRWAWWD